jgi:tellurite resistance protein TerC
MHTNLWFWIAFNAGVLCVLAIDLFGFQRKVHTPSTKEAAIWTAVWADRDAVQEFSSVTNSLE